MKAMAQYSRDGQVLHSLWAARPGQELASYPEHLHADSTSIAAFEAYQTMDVKSPDATWEQFFTYMADSIMGGSYGWEILDLPDDADLARTFVWMVGHPDTRPDPTKAV